MKYKGSCHCGRIAFEVEGVIGGALACNCSICQRKGSLLWFVPRGDLHLLTPESAASRYTFNKHAIEHRFCPVCGMHPYAEASDPQGHATAAVNIRCLEGIDIEAIPVQHYDGRALQAGRQLDPADARRALRRSGSGPRWRALARRCKRRTLPHTWRAQTMDDKPVSDTWQRGSPYERYVGRWSRLVAPPFLAWLNVAAGRRWLDVGCGTGALCAAIAERCSPSAVTGVEPSEGFLETARANLAGRAALLQGSAGAIPLDDASVDVVVSGLVLNFVADQSAALREMARVSGSGGTIAAYVWDYAGKMELMRYFWDVASALDPKAASLDEGVRFPMCRPDALDALFAGAGLEDVAVTAIDIPTPFANFDDYWQPFLGGQGPAPAYAMSLDAPARARLRDGIQERLPTEASGSIALTARAWAVRAAVAG